jgi:hypothetical protein
MEHELMFTPSLNSPLPGESAYCTLICVATTVLKISHFDLYKSSGFIICHLCVAITVSLATQYSVSLGDLVVTVLSIPKVHGFKPSQGQWTFKGNKKYIA